MRHTSLGAIHEPAGSRATLRRSFEVLNALDQVGVLGTIFVPHRLYRCLERSLVLDLDDLDARSLDLLVRLLLHGVPKRCAHPAAPPWRAWRSAPGRPARACSRSSSRTPGFPGSSGAR